MNDRARLTQDQTRRLLAEADEIDARAATLVLAVPEGGGAGERLLDRQILWEADALRKKAQRRRERAARAQTCGIRISDHARIRHIERVYGLDLSALDAEILPEAAADVAARLGDGEYPVETAAGAHLVTVRGQTAVTVTVIRSA